MGTHVQRVLGRANESMSSYRNSVVHWIQRHSKTLFVLTICVALLGVFIIVEYLSSSDRSDRFHSGRLRLILPNHRGRQTAQSTYDWSVGGNEIRQYRQFMWVNPHFRLKLVDEPITLEFDPNYYYNVKHVGTDVIAENGVSVSIEERYRKTTTSGGSCFYVFSETASSTIRQMCSFWDFFNGTYVVWCPAMGGEPCMDISILLQYTNFTAYTSNDHPMQHVIWRETVCTDTTIRTNYVLASPNLRSRVDGLLKSPILWERTIDDHFALKTEPNQTFQTMTQSTLCACVKRFRKLIMVGSSHMRFKADYLISKCYELPAGLSKSHHELSVGNISFIWRSHGSHFTTLLNNELASDKLNRGDVVILQTGAHDMAYIGLQETLATMIDSYSYIIEQLKRRSEQIGFQLIVVTSPPVADDHEQYRRGSRNCCALSAFVYELHARLISTDVDIFDEFSVILPWQRRAACTGHYMCFNIRRNEPLTLKGEVGELALLLLMDRVCRQTR